MAKSLKFEYIYPRNFWQWNNHQSETFEFPEAEISMDAFVVNIVQKRHTEYSLTGRAENFITSPSHTEAFVSFKVFTYAEMLKVRQWYDVASLGKADRDYTFTGYPTVLAPSGIGWFAWTDDNMEPTSLRVGALEGDGILDVDILSDVNASMPWMMIEFDEGMAPRKHYFVITEQTYQLSHYDWGIEPAVTRDFSANSILQPLYMLEPGVATNGTFREEFDSDMQYWRVEFSYRTIHTNWRHRFAPFT
jgi:hypothetical protein